MKKYRNSKSAFTLIELILVIAIISFLTISAYSSFVNFSENQKFQQDFNEILNYFKIARSDALANKSVPDFTDANGNGIYNNNQNPNEFTSPAGFGVHVDMKLLKFFYFADIIPQPGLSEPAGTVGEFNYCPNSNQDGCDFIYQYFEPKNLTVTLQPDQSESIEHATIIFSPYTADLNLSVKGASNLKKLQLKLTDPKNPNRCRIIELRSVSSSIEQLPCS